MPPWLIIFLASFLVWFMAAAATLLARQALLPGLVAWFVAQLLKWLHHTPRPFELNGAGTFTLWAKPDGSFPSGHTALAFALATAVLLHRRNLGLIFIAAALLVGVGRVLSNVHYPIDILAGAAIGTTIALFFHFHRPINKKHLVSR